MPALFITTVDYISMDSPFLLDATGYRHTKRILMAFYHPLRFKLFQLIHQCHWITVPDLCIILGIGETPISLHLNILRAAGLVQTRRKGTTYYYTPNYKRLAVIEHGITHLQSKKSIEQKHVSGA